MLVNGTPTEWFDFIAVLDIYVMTKWPESSEYWYLQSALDDYLTDMEFADNITISESEANLQKLVDNLIFYSEDANLTINTKKIKVMTNRPTSI